PLEDCPPPGERVHEIQERFGLGEEVVVAGGRMGFFKGQQLLLESFARLATRRSGAQLALAGRNDDWFGAWLARRAAELGIHDRVVFTGFLPRPVFLSLWAAG